MDLFFAKEEFEFTHKIIDLGLLHAAQALSKLIQDDVYIHEKEFNIEQKDFIIASIPDEYHILSTKIVGEIFAKSFLIFNQKNANKLWEITIPEHSREEEEMKKALLMEVDNILTASVVTQISQILKIHAYGDVPYYECLNKMALEESFGAQIDEYNIIFSMKTSLVSKNTDIQPQFVWCFQESFLDVIKNYAYNQETISLIEEGLAQMTKE